MDNTHTRYVKPVIFNSMNDIDKIEGRVNFAADAITKAGGKIVSYVPLSFGLSPMTLIYNIIYESDKPIEVKFPDKRTETTGKKGK